MASDMDSVNQICEKVEALEINSNPSSVAEDGKALIKLSSRSRGDKETRASGLPSTSQSMAVNAGYNVVSSAYIAPSGHPAPLVYSYGVNNPYVLGTDGYQQSAFVNDFGYHYPGYQNEVTPFIYPSIDGGYLPRTFYNPGVTPITPLGTDNTFYGYQFQHPVSHYPQVSYPEYQYWTTFPSDIPPSEAVMPGPEDLGVQGTYLNGIQVGNSYLFGGRPGFQSYLMPPNGSYGRGIFPSAFTNSVPVEAAIGYDSTRPPIAHWTDPRNLGNHQGNGVSPGIHTTGQFLPAVQFPPTQQPVYSPHVPTSLHPLGGLPFGVPSSATQLRTNDGLMPYQIETRGEDPEWAVGNKRWAGNGNHFDDGQVILGGSSDTMQHPTGRPINEEMASSGQSKGQFGLSDRVNEILSFLGDGNSYNRSDFITNYNDAKFFVIKSYSEDDIHKSIKYNVWASTPNGNQKLNQAYQDAQLRAGDKPGDCPIFFFFSVNGSGRFCGVAEMVGPVDFSKSMDFWQQDKWTGSFSVRWHIIKDIPNSVLRHIILKNNDNKPVTNSRDTQEINLREGLQMLDIFKNFLAHSSIVDEFYLYESRQRAMQEKRARQKTEQQTHLVENISTERIADGLNEKSDPPQSSIMRPQE